MRVLLVVSDLFSTVGGAQTVYRRVVESSPDIEFYYLRRFEAADHEGPRNAHAISLQARSKLSPLTTPLLVPRFGTVALNDADQIARSVAGMSFDIVDYADPFYDSAMCSTARSIITMSRWSDSSWGLTGTSRGRATRSGAANLRQRLYRYGLLKPPSSTQQMLSTLSRRPVSRLPGPHRTGLRQLAMVTKRDD
jgi:hypothetical protein